jgi:hypothetical protein
MQLLAVESLVVLIIVLVRIACTMIDEIQQVIQAVKSVSVGVRLHILFWLSRLLLRDKYVVHQQHRCFSHVALAFNLRFRTCNCKVFY